MTILSVNQIIILLEIGDDPWHKLYSRVSSYANEINYNAKKLIELGLVVSQHGNFYLTSNGETVLADVIFHHDNLGVNICNRANYRNIQEMTL